MGSKEASVPSSKIKLRRGVSGRADLMLDMLRVSSVAVRWKLRIAMLCVPVETVVRTAVCTFSR